MHRSNGVRLFLVLAGLVAALGAVTLAKGGLYIDRHEGDTLHLTEILLRMGQGQWPHLDFVTPLGVASFLPMSSLVKAGFGVGQSILLAQVLVACCMLPAAWWVARTRFAAHWDMAFGATILVMVLAMVHGEGSPNVSMSMHYNRWAWAGAFVAVPLAMLPARAGAGSKAGAWIDGTLIALALSFFILGKITYGVALAPGLLLSLVLRGALSSAVIAVLGVCVAMAATTVALGFEFWGAYLGDLAQVKSSGIRPRAGVDMATLLLAPRFLIGNLVLVAAIVLLRRGSHPDLGLMLIALAPGFLYITYQNYGNDPKWLALVAFMMIAVGTSLQHRLLALVAAALIAPSFLNMAVSPARHLLLDKSNFVAVLPDAPHTDLLTPKNRVNRVQERRTVTFADPQFESLNEFADLKPDVTFQGITYPSCLQELGLFGVLREMGRDLRQFGLSGEAQVFTTDTFDAVWMFAGLTPLQGGAPWYYGDVSGFENAGYVLVPTCPITPRTFEASIEALKAMDGLKLKELRRTELYTLYEKVN